MTSLSLLKSFKNLTSLVILFCAVFLTVEIQAAKVTGPETTVEIKKEAVEAEVKPKVKTAAEIRAELIAKRRSKRIEANKKIAAERRAKRIEANKKIAAERRMKRIEGNKKIVAERRAKRIEANKKIVVERRVKRIEADKKAAVERSERWNKAKVKAEELIQLNHKIVQDKKFGEFQVGEWPFANYGRETIVGNVRYKKIILDNNDKKSNSNIRDFKNIRDLPLRGEKKRCYEMMGDIKISYECYCGDGHVDEGEACDDGNKLNNDGCNSSCALENNDDCGNDTLDTGEDCDDGNTTNGDGCSSSCALEICDIDEDSLSSDVYYHDYPDATHISECVNEGTVRYTICPNDDSVSVATVNIDPCPSGLVCENGVCDEPNLSSCYDTDPGLDIDVKGVITGTDAFGFPLAPKSDYCKVDGPDNEVTQRECDGTNMVVVTSICNEGDYCLDGTCSQGLPPECEDSDPGNDKDIFGEISTIDPFGTELVMVDWCNSVESVIQYECVDGQRIRVPPLLCDDGERCEGGVCGDVSSTETVTPTCEDSDPDDDEDVYGEVVATDQYGVQVTNHDFCVYSNTEVYQFKCVDGEKAISGSSVCDTGKICYLGACIEDPTSSCTCSRTVGVAADAGYITGKDCVVQHDICSGDDQIKFKCGADGMPEIDTQQSCTNSCSNGVCL